MRNNIFKLVLVLSMTLTFIACDKEDGPVLTTVKPSVLNSPATGNAVTLSFTAGQPQNSVVFDFNRAVYDPVISVNYQIFAKFVNRAGRDTVINVTNIANIPTNLPSTISVYHRELNIRLCTLTNKGALAHGSTTPIDFYVKSYGLTKHGDNDIILVNPGTVDGPANTVTVTTY